MKTYGGSGGIAPPFLTLALDGGEWSASCPSLTAGETAPGTHCKGGWVGPRASLHIMSLPGIDPDSRVTILTELSPLLT
jgi:hypothetical protein